MYIVNFIDFDKAGIISDLSGLNLKPNKFT